METELEKLIELTEELTKDGHLRHQTDGWECVLDSIPDCIYITNTNKYIRFINRKLQFHLGISDKEDAYTETCFSLLGNKECLDGSEKTEKGILECNEASEIVFLSKLNGWFKSNISPIYSKAGRLLGYICVLKEATERKMSEQFAVERQRMLDTIYVSVPAGIVVVEEDDLVLKFVNNSLLKLTGYSESDLIEGSVRKLFESDLSADTAFSIINNNEYTNGSITIETVWKTKAGAKVDILINVIKTIGTYNIIFNAIDITAVYRE